MARQDIAAMGQGSPLEAMLETAARRSPSAPAAQDAQYAPVEGPAETAFGALETIEARAGASRPEARKAAERVLAAGQAIEQPSGSEGNLDARTIAQEIRSVAEEIAGDFQASVEEAQGKSRIGREAEGESAPRSPGAAP